MRTANPALQPRFLDSNWGSTTDRMTISGTINKSLISAGILLLAASWTWIQASTYGPASVMPWIIVGGIGGFICAIVTFFKKEWAKTTVPIYAVLEGLLLGAVSSIFEQQYPGIVIQAVGLTIGTLFCMLGAYQSGMIKVTNKFKMGLASAMGGLMLVYFVSFILMLFGVRIPLFENGIIGIGFSLVVVGIAALNLVLDFDAIEELSQRGAPHYMEWYGAFTLMVTLIWLYLEILRLLVKLRSRD